MKLLTHNMLTSKSLKNVMNGFPLKIEATEVQTVEVDFNPEFTVKMLSKIDWSALTFAAKCVGHCEGLPESLPEEVAQDESLLKKIHHVMMEVDVVNGTLECPETKRAFPITNGIPNMLLNEDEV